MASDFSRWMSAVLPQWPGGLDTTRQEEYNAIIGYTEELLRMNSVWEEIPRRVYDVFGSRGWAWNGFYVRNGRQLELAAAYGPPVCSPLELQGDAGVGSSGSCWDAILMNQVIVLGDSALWPGYISCDDDSGLETASGLVCPVRGADYAPIAVWDLDAEQPIYPEDAWFMGCLFDTLSVVSPPAFS